MLRAQKTAMLSISAASCGRRNMSSIMDVVKSFFMQAKDLTPSQSMFDSTTYRAKAPAAGVQDGPKPVVPETGSPDSAFKIAYYERDTRRPNTWTYVDAEGKPLPATPMKYMDGTPFLPRIEPAKPVYTQASVGIHEIFKSSEPSSSEVPLNIGKVYRWKKTDGTSTVISNEVSRS